MLKYTITNLDTNESYYPILNNETELESLIETNKVLYGENYEVSFVDITSQYQAELELKKTKRKEDLANEVKTYVISKIKDFAIADKLAMLGRGDISAIMAFLNYGSLEQSKTLLEAATVDTILTQELKTEILGVIQAKITQYNSIVW